MACESQGPEAVGAHVPLRHVPGHREDPGILAGERKGSPLTTQSEIFTPRSPRAQGEGGPNLSREGLDFHAKGPASLVPPLAGLASSARERQRFG